VWSWVFYGLGGTVGCLIGGFVLSGTDPVTNAPTGNPYVCIFIQGCFSVLIALSGFLIDKKLEENQAELREMTFRQRSSFVLKEVKQGLKLKEMYSTIIFYLVIVATVPKFTTYLYYYQI
jgi:hypothetical protein